MATPRKPNTPPTPIRKPAAAVQTIENQQFENLPAFFKNTWLHSAVIAALAILIYANTLKNQWALDDAIVITDNMFTQKGVSGVADIFSKDTFFGFFKEEGKAALVSGGRYRPLTPAIFAVIYQVFGKNPMVFHLFTVLLFAATCLVLHRTLLALLKSFRGEGYAALVAFVAAGLFAAHPVHTEAVANIKGCDEIATLLGSLGALWLSLRAFDSKNVFFSVAAGAVFFLALLSKENAVTFLGVVPLALWVFRGANFQQISLLVLPLALAFLVFFGIRSSVLPTLFAEEPMELMNNPYLKLENGVWKKFSTDERAATISYTLGKYVQLLAVPHPLTHDYYPRHVDIQNFGKPAALLSFVGYLAMAVLAALWLLRGRRKIVAFGIAFYLMTLLIVSNIVFPIGTNMGERFLFMPSVGFCLLVAALLVGLANFDGRKLALPMGIFGAAVLLFSVKTFSRNPDWYDDKTLFFKDLTTSTRSAKIYNACGGVCCTEGGQATDEAQKKELYARAIGYLTKALEIHPTYKDALLNRGISQFHLKNFDAAIADFRQAAFVAPNDPKGKTNLAIALRDGAKFYGEQKGDLARAVKYLNESIQIAPTDLETMRLLGVANGVSGNSAEAIKWFSKVVEAAPDNASSLYDLGQAHGAAGNAAKAQELMGKALQMNPKLLEERAKQK